MSPYLGVLPLVFSALHARAGFKALSATLNFTFGKFNRRLRHMPAPIARPADERLDVALDGNLCIAWQELDFRYQTAVLSQQCNVESNNCRPC